MERKRAAGGVSEDGASRSICFKKHKKTAGSRRGGMR